MIDNAAAAPVPPDFEPTLPGIEAVSQVEPNGEPIVAGEEYICDGAELLLLYAIAETARTWAVLHTYDQSDPVARIDTPTRRAIHASEHALIDAVHAYRNYSAAPASRISPLLRGNSADTELTR